MVIEIKVSETTRQDIANSLRLIADQIEREHPTVTHWGGHQGRSGSYSVSVLDASGTVLDNL